MPLNTQALEHLLTHFVPTFPLGSAWQKPVSLFVMQTIPPTKSARMQET